MDSEFETAFERPPLKVIDNNVKRPAPKKGAIEQQFREGTNTTKPKDAKVKKETKKKKTATATAAPKAKKTKAGGGQMQPNATVPDNVSPYFANDLDQYESMNEDEAETAYLVARANDHYD